MGFVNKTFNAALLNILYFAFKSQRNFLNIVCLFEISSHQLKIFDPYFKEREGFLNLGTRDSFLVRKGKKIFMRSKLYTRY